MSTPDSIVAIVRRHAQLRLAAALVAALALAGAYIAAIADSAAARDAAGVAAAYALVVGLAVPLVANGDARRALALLATSDLLAAAWWLGTRPGDAAATAFLLFAFVPLASVAPLVGVRRVVQVMTVALLCWGAIALPPAVGRAPGTWLRVLWPPLAFAFVTTMEIVRHRGRSRRLAELTHVLEQAQRGDFSGRYPVARDAIHDHVTRLGAAFNAASDRIASLLATDPLTGCLNRRGLEHALERELARAGRRGERISVVAIDLDRFKRVNDTLGHQAGDSLLVQASALMAQIARQGDVVARIGGEEFVVILPATGEVQALAFANRACHGFRAHTFMVVGRALRVTISAGVATIERPIPEDAAALIGEADAALYRAKRLGRDRAEPAASAALLAAIDAARAARLAAPDRRSPSSAA